MANWAKDAQLPLARILKKAYDSVPRGDWFASCWLSDWFWARVAEEKYAEAQALLVAVDIKRLPSTTVTGLLCSSQMCRDKRRPDIDHAAFLARVLAEMDPAEVSRLHVSERYA
jgi:hypothetical protein